MLRILVIDVDRAFCDKFAAALKKEPDFESCGALRQIPESGKWPGMKAPDVAVIGVDLDDASAVAELTQMKRTFTQSFPHVVLLAEKVRPAPLEELLRECAGGCALKSDAPAEWLEAIRVVARGEMFVSRSITPTLLQHVLSVVPEPARFGVETLTDRELRIFELIGDGFSVVEIADRLQVSCKTIESHREKIKHRLGLTDSRALSHLAFIWAQRGMADPGHTKEMPDVAFNRRKGPPSPVIPFPLGDNLG